MNTAEKIALLRDRFVNRDNAFVEQWYNKKKEEGGYRKVVNQPCPHNPECPRGKCPEIHDLPLTDRVLIEHLQGKKTIGTYQLNDESTVKWLVLDVDVQKGAEFAADDARQAVQATTVQLAKVAKRFRLPFAVEDSGSRGYHLWFFFVEPIPAAWAQAVGYWLIEKCGELRVGIGVEVYPKQGYISAYGNLVKIPLGIHQKTGRRCFFVDYLFQPYADQWAAILRTPKIEKDAVARLIARYRIEIQPPRSFDDADDSLISKYAPPCLVRLMREGAPEGMRDLVAFKLGCYFRAQGLPPEMAWVAMEEWNTMNDPPLPESLLQTKIDSAYSKGYSFYPCRLPEFAPFCDESCPIRQKGGGPPGLKK